jgi:hypothetical protein
MFFSEAGQLQWVRAGEQVGWTGMKVGPKRNLCTGESLVSLIIHGGPRWSDAKVTVDDVLVEYLSKGSTPGLQIDVPAYHHRISVTGGASRYSTDIDDSKGRIQINPPPLVGPQRQLQFASLA